MADAATSALVKVIFDKLTDEAFKKYARAQGIHSELENLGEELSLTQALLHDASEKEVTEKSVGLWLNRLQHVACDMEEVLDDVATEAMRRELTQESGASTSKVIYNSNSVDPNYNQKRKKPVSSESGRGSSVFRNTKELLEFMVLLC